MDTKTVESSPAEFAHSITRLAISQIIQSTGYRAARSSALETLTRLSILHLRSLSDSAARSAALSSRTQPNLLDFVSAIEDLSLPRGFLGASSLHSRRNPFVCGAVKKVRDFVVFYSREIPFAKPIPPRCSSGSDGTCLLGSTRGEMSNQGVRGPENPRWLPEFPIVKRKEKEADRRREAYGEEVAETSGRREGESVEKGKGLLPWRRERVRFKFKGSVKNNKQKKCGVVGVDLKLKRKRVCLDETSNRVVLGRSK